MNFVNVIKEILELSGVGKSDKVLLFTCRDFEGVRPGTRPTPGPGFIDAIRIAVESLGTDCFILQVSNEIYRGRTARVPQFEEILKPFTFLINVPPTAPEVNRVMQKNGARALTIHQDEEVHRRLMPTPELKKRVMAGVSLLEQAEKIRITTAAGTDLTCVRGGRKCHAEYGMADEPGRWDNAAAGIVAVAPIESSLNGKLVIEAGSGICHLCYVTEDIVCTVKDGYITEIAGGASAMLLQDYFDYTRDNRSRMISHLGWGAHTGAYWPSGQLIDSAMDWEALYANCLLGWGNNAYDFPHKYSGLNGINPVGWHLDMALKICDFYLDDVLIVSDGKYVHKDLQSVKAEYDK